jgi:hypothetical protein
MVDAEVARHNPVHSDLTHAVRSAEAIELLSHILDLDYQGAVDAEPGAAPARPTPQVEDQPGVWTRGAYRRWIAPRPKLVLAAATLLVVGAVAGTLASLGGGGLSRPFKTSWRPAHPLAAPEKAVERSGTWRLVDALLTGTWQQNVYGPPPGWFSCSPGGSCFVLAGKYPSVRAGAPLLSESLYVSGDQGATWAAFPLPAGLVPTTPLECSGPQWCAAGATFNGQPALAITRNGGHSFTVDPLPTGVGTLFGLACPATAVCEGLTAASTSGTTPVDATFLVINNGGSTFHDEAIVAGESMTHLACISATDCTVVGQTDAAPSAVSAVTTDQGRTWKAGSLPAGFGIDRWNSLACPDERHCFVTGQVPMRVKNPPICSTLNSQSPTQATTQTLPNMSSQVAAISKKETEILFAEVAKQTTVNLATCRNGISSFGDVASSKDGGLTWTPEMLPSDVPGPSLTGLSCPTATECWTGGQEAVPVTLKGGGIDMGSPVLIGTTDGGATWSKVVFTVPSTAPNLTSQTYLSMGSVTCPTANVCLARGMAAQSARYAPVYSLIKPRN